MKKIFVIVLAALMLQGCATPEGGAILGGIVGGVIGNRFGGGNGNTIATGAGAVIGSMMGQNMSDKPTPTTQVVIQKAKAAQHTARQEAAATHTQQAPLAFQQQDPMAVAAYLRGQSDKAAAAQAILDQERRDRADAAYRCGRGTGSC